MSLVILLTLLQLAAPLVHAHAGETAVAFSGSNPGKLHIPGLEGYGSGDETLLFESGGYDYNAEGVIIGVDTGIKQNQAKFIKDLSNPLFLVQPAALVLKPWPSPLVIDLSLAEPLTVGRLPAVLPASRAPPRQ